MALNRLSAQLGHVGFLRYLKNTSWMLGEHMLRISGGFFVSVLVARYLGPSQFGLLSYAIAFTFIFRGLAKLGLDEVMVRELVNNPEKSDIYLGTAFWLKVFGAVFVIGLLAVLLPFTNNETNTKIFIFIIAAGFFCQSFDVIDFYFQSRVLAKTVSICKSLQLILSSLLKIYLVLTEADLIFFVLVTTFDAISLAFFYCCAFNMTKLPPFYISFDLNIAKKLLTASWPLVISIVAVSAYMRIDQIMIKEMLGAQEVGTYSVAVRLSEALYFIPMLLSASLFPAILNAKKISDELFKRRQQNFYSLLVWTAVLFALLMSILGQWLVTLLFGISYEGAGQVLLVHAWSAIFVFLGVASGRWLIAEGLQRYSLYNTVAGCILNIALNLFFIPKFGVIGAAYATLISYFFAAYLMNAVWKKTWPNFVMMNKSLLPIRKFQ